MLIAVPTIVFAVLSTRGNRPVTCTTGRVSIDVTSAGRGGTIVKLKAADHAFNLPRPPGGVLAELPEAYGRVLTDQPYHVYVYGSRVVAMEPAADGTPLSIGQSIDAQPIPVRGYRPLRMKGRHVRGACLISYRQCRPNCL